MDQDTHGDSAPQSNTPATASDDSSGGNRTVPILGAVIGLALIALIVFLLLRDRGPGEAVVPDVGGMSIEGARIALESEGLLLGDIAEQERTDIGAGVIITQTPDPGSVILDNEHVDVVSSISVEWVKTPDVTRLSIDEAEEVMRAAGLEPVPYQGYSREVAQGFVADQINEYNVPTRSGDPVLLLVSLGYRTGGVVVPQLPGSSVADAAAAVEAAGLTPVIVSLHTNSTNIGSLAGQIPAAGTRVPENAKVAIVVLVGPEE